MKKDMEHNNIEDKITIGERAIIEELRSIKKIILDYHLYMIN